MIWIAVILFISVLAFDVFSDYAKWLEGESVKHTKEFFLRLALLSPSLLILILWKGESYIVITGVTLAMVGFVYWSLFDGFYNLIRKFNFFFTGSDDPDDAISDNLLQSIPKWAQICIKIGGSIVFTFLYFYL